MSEFGFTQLNAFKPGLTGNRLSQNKVMENNTSGIAGGSSQSFVDTLENVLNDTNKALQSADKASNDFSAGRATSLHDVMISMEKADLSLKTVTAVRNKMVEAYQEIMRMQV